MTVLSGCNIASSEFAEVYFTVVVPESTQSSMVAVYLYDIESGDARGGFFMTNYLKESDTRVFYQRENIRPGQYTAVAYNFGTDAVELRLYEFVTRAATDSTKMMPGVLAAAKVTPVIVSQYSSVVIFCPLVTTETTVKVGVEGLQYATGMSGCVSGFGTSYSLDSCKATAAEMLSFDLKAASADTLEATIRSFGKVGPAYDFTFNITTSGGAYKYSATTDSTFKFPGKIVIPEPAPGSGSGKDGFNPEVGQWKDYSVIIPV